jgi:hypothetical protein
VDEVIRYKGLAFANSTFDTFSTLGLTGRSHGRSVLQLLSTSPSKTSLKSTRFGLSDCKDRIPRRWSLRSGRHSHNADQICWTSTASSERRWRKGGGLPLICLHWTPFASGSQVANSSSRMGFIASPPEHGCLAPNVLGVSNTGAQQASMQNAECSREEPNQVTFFITFSSFHHGLPSVLLPLSDKIC